MIRLYKLSKQYPSGHRALEQASDPGTRERWARNGLARIEELGLTPQEHAERLYSIVNSDELQQ